MTQQEFSHLIDEYYMLDDSFGRLNYDDPDRKMLEDEMQKLAENILSARDTSKDGMTLAKMDEGGEITVINAVMYEDDDISPDGISYYYDIWKIREESSEMPFTGGCYYGFVNIESMLESEGFDIKSMIDVSNSSEIDDMIADNCFEYEQIVQILNRRRIK